MNKKVRLLNLAKIGTVILAMAVILNIFLIGNANNTTFMELISTDIGYNIIFMVAMINILCFFQLDKIVKSIKSNKGINENIFLLIVVILVELVTFNYIVSGLMIFWLYKNKLINRKTLQDKWKSILNKKKKYIIYGDATVFMALVAILYTTIFSII